MSALTGIVTPSSYSRRATSLRSAPSAGLHSPKSWAARASSFVAADGRRTGMRHLPTGSFSSLPKPMEAYFASKDGRIFSTKRVKTGRELRQRLNTSGYPVVRLQTGWVSVHRLVFQAFHGTMPEGTTVNHKNGDKEDNRLINLEPASVRENVYHSGRVLKNRSGFKFSDTQVKAIRMHARRGETFVELSQRYGATPPAIARLCYGETYAHVPGWRCKRRGRFRKLRCCDYARIRALHREGYTQKKIASMFSVSQTQVSRVCRGETK